MSDIFISYKREERPIARKLANALESEGWSVWWDPKLRAGEYFDDVIEKALNEAKCVIVMWSNLAVTSEYIKAEATEALEEKKLVPVKIEDVNLPFRFKRVHTLSLLGWDGSKDFSEFQRLVDDISTILGPSTTPAAAEERRGLEADERRKLEEEYRREQERQRYEAEAKRKADEENQKNHAAHEARAQRTAEKESLRQQERQRFEQESRDKAAREQPNDRLEPGTVFRDKLKDGSQGPEMVVIPAGTFRMGDINRDGSESERPVHAVQIIKPFAIGRYDVTFEEYDAFATATGRELPPDEGWGRGRLPVVNAYWYDAVAYTEWLSAQTGKRYRLPTEAEWEYAARAGTETSYWWGDEMKSGMGHCKDGHGHWSGKRTAPVGSFKPNPFGLYDTAGNVWEWVEDCSHYNYEGAPADGSAWLQATMGDCGQRMIRGGSWYDIPGCLRSAKRFHNNPFSRKRFIGFRVSRDID